MPTLTPPFKEFLPGWVARQPWYLGSATPTLRPVGFLRLEDPDGEVGMETHLVTDGDAVYQVPMTYRGAPLDRGSLVATAEHSELGRRWIYDAPTDPVWVAELLRVVHGDATAEPSIRAAAGSVPARGHRIRDFTPDQVRVEVQRVPGAVPTDPDVVGVFTGAWTPDTAERCFAVVREIR